MNDKIATNIEELMVLQTGMLVQIATLLTFSAPTKELGAQALNAIEKTMSQLTVVGARIVERETKK